jgi:hypothetical protein
MDVCHYFTFLKLLLGCDKITLIRLFNVPQTHTVFTTNSQQVFPTGRIKRHSMTQDFICFNGAKHLAF